MEKKVPQRKTMYAYLSFRLGPNIYIIFHFLKIYFATHQLTENDMNIQF
jgi:hypothetical protein